MKTSRALLKLLEDRGVDTIFGYPGGAVIPIFNEIVDSSVNFILVRHEQCAAHMADGYARASGKPGVCLVTSGPGVTNAITGVATAYADSIPIMALTGQVAAPLLGTGAFQEVDAFSLMMPITKYNYRILEPEQLTRAVDEGWKVMQNGRPGPVHIDLPVDVMNMETDESWLSEKYEPRKVDTDTSQLIAAITAIKNAKKPVIMAGGGVIGSNSSSLLIQLAEMIGAPVVTPLMGIGSIPFDHPLYLGTLGMHGNLAALDAIKNADLVIAIGTKFSDRTYCPATSVSRGCKIIQIDIDPTEFNKHNAPAINLMADVNFALHLIIGGLDDTPVKPNPEWIATATEFKKKCDSCVIDINEEVIVPQKIMHEINKILDDDMIVTTDVGQNQMWAMHHLNIKNPRQFISSGNLGTMGFGFPAALGAKIACPDKKVLAITGDGGFMMVMQELATSISNDIPVVVCLLNNGWLGMVKQWQKLFWNARYSGTSLVGTNPDFVKLAESFGAYGIRVTKPEEIEVALKQAFANDKTTIIDIWINPEEDTLPMIPPNPDIPLIKGRCKY